MKAQITTECRVCCVTGPLTRAAWHVLHAETCIGIRRGPPTSVLVWPCQPTPPWNNGEPHSRQFCSRMQAGATVCLQPSHPCAVVQTLNPLAGASASGAFRSSLRRSSCTSRSFFPEEVVPHHPPERCPYRLATRILHIHRISSSGGVTEPPYELRTASALTGIANVWLEWPIDLVLVVIGTFAAW